MYVLSAQLYHPWLFFKRDYMPSILTNTHQKPQKNGAMQNPLFIFDGEYKLKPMIHERTNFLVLYENIHVTKIILQHWICTHELVNNPAT